MTLGFDYELQVWHRDGIILDCAHPDSMSRNGKYCCNERKYKGITIEEARKIESAKIGNKIKC